jgi:hypothetical protein
MQYQVTEDGRQAAVHERPAHAGSGEKRLAAVRQEVKPDPAAPHIGDLDAGPIGEEEIGVGEGA